MALIALFEITLQNIVAVDKWIAVEEQTSELLWTMSVYDIHNVILHNATYSAKIKRSYFKARYIGYVYVIMDKLSLHSAHSVARTLTVMVLTSPSNVIKSTPLLRSVTLEL